MTITMVIKTKQILTFQIGNMAYGHIIQIYLLKQCVLLNVTSILWGTVHFIFMEIITVRLDITITEVEKFLVVLIQTLNIWLGKTSVSIVNNNDY